MKGLLYMRIQELMTAGSTVRFGLIFVICFGLFLLIGLDPEGVGARYEGFVAGVFALKFLPVFCLTKGGETLRSELKDGTIEYLWVRPASKAELYLAFVCSSYLGILALIVPALLGISLAGLAMGAVSFGGLLSLWISVLTAIASFTAISGAISSFSSKFVVLGIFYYSFVELGLGSIPNGVQRLAVSFHTRTLLNGFSTGGANFSLESFAWILGTGFVALALGTVIFSQSRYGVGGEKEA